MLDELLTQKEGADPYMNLGYPDIPSVITRDALVMLHREIAQHGSQQKGDVPRDAARVVAELVKIASAAAWLDGEAVQKAVEHVVSALRWAQTHLAVHANREATRELDAARMWMVQARMSSI